MSKQSGIKWLISQFRKMICMHNFNLKDLQERNSDGNVTWSCFKCGKFFIAECGLDVLKNGRCVEQTKN
jgi:hypoxanthine-guanine phosphoribosyltransferase